MQQQQQQQLTKLSPIHHNHMNQRPFRIITQYGDMLVIKQGPEGSNRPCIMTFHDLGLNSDFQFNSFCELDEVKLLLKTFNFIHVNFIGQELHSETLPTNHDYQYPTMEQLAEAIVDICVQMRVRSFIGMGVGAGAYVLSLCALNRPDLVDGLFLINPIASSCSWTEWIYSKMTALCNKATLHRPVSSQSTHKPPQQPSASANTIEANHHFGLMHQNTLDQFQQECNNHSASTLHKKMTPTARLRHIIASKSFGKHHQQQQQQQQQQNLNKQHVDESPTIRTKHNNTPLTDSSSEGDKATDKGGDTHSPGNSSVESKGHESPNNQPRLPIEYLMYHHFGPVSVGRCRRLSDTGLEQHLGSAGSARGTGGSETTAARGKVTQDDLATNKNTKNEGRDLAILEGSSSSARYTPGTVETGEQQTTTTTTIASATSIGTILSGITNEKQRQAKIQIIYKGYFKRINRHNLILFTQAFLRRSNLNLRKDCGAAAHAAAAAAALGASVCSPSAPGGGMISRGAGGSPHIRYATGANTPTTGSSGDAKVGAHSSRLNSASSVGSEVSQCSCSGHSSGLNSVSGGTPIHSRGSGSELSMSASTKSESGDGSGDRTVTNTPAVQNTAEESSVSDTENDNNISTTKDDKDQNQTTTRVQQQQLGEGTNLTSALLSAGNVAAQAGSTQVAATGLQSRIGGNGSPPVLVAGTKVKKTFSCQTLIMCSSVSTHCDQALSLMSKLNPLQSTWIKTDALLVLEERPDKVCQALRLFLQGIGYSMSTYERRLRLTRAAMGSSQGSQGSQGNGSTGATKAQHIHHHQGNRHCSACARRQSSVPSQGTSGRRAQVATTTTKTKATTTTTNQSSKIVTNDADQQVQTSTQTVTDTTQKHPDHHHHHHRHHDDRHHKETVTTTSSTGQQVPASGTVKARICTG